MKSESLRPDDYPATANSAGEITVTASESIAPSLQTFPLHIPAILLEGDDCLAEEICEDAQKFSLGPEASVSEPETEGELPESYGTQKLLLTARDPHWLYAHWDLTREQQRDYCKCSADGHLTLRVNREDVIGEPVAEINVHPDARHWFVHITQSGSQYNAELGCRTSRGDWISISNSAPTFAPPGKSSENTSAEFATIPFETPLPDLIALAAGAAAPNLSLTEALENLRRQGHPDLPPAPPVTTWTAEQERALAEIFNLQTVRSTAPSSLDLSETVSSLPQSLGEWVTSPGGNSSLFGGEQSQRGFWFNVNAELIVYGATEPNATVTIGGWPVKLRDDGSFSFRFALPDGSFELPVVAVSADNTEARAADLKFSRDTERRGDVGDHPQDAKLKTPAPENL